MTSEKKSLDSSSSNGEKQHHTDGYVEDPSAPVPHVPSDIKKGVDGIATVETDSSIDGEEQDESIRLVPKVVRELVSMEDDPNLPTITFR